MSELTEADQNAGIVIEAKTSTSVLRRRPSWWDSSVSSFRIPLIIAMVGLPARGKTYIGRRLTHYLNWVGIRTKVFNVGDYRRKASGHPGAEFFSPDNVDAVRIRNECARIALEDVFAWLEAEDGEVAVFDATNTTRERRQFIYDEVVVKRGVRLFFIESFCDDDAVIDANIREVKVNNPDYVGMDVDKAAADFMERIRQYEKNYQTIDVKDDPHLSFIRIVNQGQRFMINRPGGHLQSRIVYYLMNTRVITRTIYLTRHGESEHNLCGKIGGDSDLSPRGRRYAEELADYFSNTERVPDLMVWMSQMKRTHQTAAFVDAPKSVWKALNEINAGICEEMTYEEIQLQHPREFAMRDEDKYNYRYPNGESYGDLVGRLEPVMMELERRSNVLVICHQAVARCILGYFLDVSHDQLPYVPVPLHTIIKLTPAAYGCHMEKIPLDVPAVSTHRDRPKNISLGRSIEEALETAPPEMRPGYPNIVVTSPTASS